MKRIDVYILSSVARTLVFSVLLITLVMVLFDVFSNLDSYLLNEVPYTRIAYLALLFVPKAIIYAIGPAALFSTTYFLSMLHANNEMIIISNSGYPFRRVIIPILFLGFCLVCMQLVFTEYIAIPASLEKQLLGNETLGIRDAGDNRNVTLQAPDGSYVIHAARYREEDSRLTNVLLIKLDQQGRLRERIEATSATFNGSFWEFSDVTRHVLDIDRSLVDIQRMETYTDEEVNLESALFRNLSADITTMELTSAWRYIERIKVMDSTQYAGQASDFYSRLIGNVTPLILILISCSTVFTWKKNVLILSILSSLSIAVVFFVMQMLSMIFAKQGLYAPIWGPLAPIVVLLLISTLITILRRI